MQLRLWGVERKLKCVKAGVSSQKLTRSEWNWVYGKFGDLLVNSLESREALDWDRGAPSNELQELPQIFLWEIVDLFPEPLDVLMIRTFFAISTFVEDIAHQVFKINPLQPEHHSLELIMTEDSQELRSDNRLDSIYQSNLLVSSSLYLVIVKHSLNKLLLVVLS